MSQSHLPLKIRNLVEWEKIQEGKRHIKDYLEIELDLNQHHIRTKVTQEVDGTYSLWVPLKEAQVARDYVSGEVKTIYTTPADQYKVFDDHLRYKNRALYRERYPVTKNAVTIRRTMFIGVVILALLLFFKFS